MPAWVEKCVKGIMDDSNFKPREGRTKEESAWAICTSKYQKQKETLENKLRKNKKSNWDKYRKKK